MCISINNRGCTGICVIDSDDKTKMLNYLISRLVERERTHLSAFIEPLKMGKIKWKNSIATICITTTKQFRAVLKLPYPCIFYHFTPWLHWITKIDHINHSQIILQLTTCFLILNKYGPTSEKLVLVEGTTTTLSMLARINQLMLSAG